MTLQELMINYRAKERISQAKLAERCGVSMQTIHSVETGQQTPTRLTEAKIRLVVEEQKGENDD